jgi:hypothetical protein
MRDHRGHRNPNRALTTQLVRELVRLHGHGYGYAWLARWLGVTKSCVQFVLTGRSWSHVTHIRPPKRSRA